MRRSSSVGAGGSRVVEHGSPYSFFKVNELDIILMTLSRKKQFRAGDNDLGDAAAIMPQSLIHHAQFQRVSEDPKSMYLHLHTLCRWP